MNRAHDFSALNWIKDELDEVVRQALQILEEFVEETIERDALQGCVDRLHQVHGTLKMAQIYGPAMLAEEMELVAVALRDRQVRQDGDASEALMLSLIQLPDYLEKLKEGEFDLPLIVLPLLNDLRASRDAPLLTEAALFNPAIEIGGGGSDTANPDMPSLARAMRHKYHHGLLRLFRDSSSTKGCLYLRDVVDTLQRAAGTETVRRFFWIAGAVVRGLELGVVDSAGALRSLIGKIDQQIKRLIEGGEQALVTEPPQELQKNLLYYIGRAQTDDPLIREVVGFYDLDSLLPSEQQVARGRKALSAPGAKLFATVRDAIGGELTAIKDVIDLYMRGDQRRFDSLVALDRPLRRLGDTLGMLGQGALRARVVRQADRIAGFGANGVAPNESELMEIAGDLLFIETSLSSLDAAEEAAHPVDETSIWGRSLPQGELAVLLEKTLHESKVEMAHAKEAIVNFANSLEIGDALHGVPTQFHRIAGALRILSLNEAAEVLAKVSIYIERDLLGQRIQPDQNGLNYLADAISSIEYYMDALTEGTGQYREVLRFAEEAIDHLITVGHEEIEHDLDEMVAEVDLGELIAPHAESATLGESAHRPPPEEAPLPSAAKPALEEIDSEILEIFVDEAREELEVIEDFLPRWKSDPNDKNALITFRRSFHTLKGSGRLVGAKTIGELAWSVENMLNRLIDETIRVGPQMLALLDHVVAVLPRLIDNQERGEPACVAIEPIMAAADAIAEGREPDGELAASLVPAPTADDEFDQSDFVERLIVSAEDAGDAQPPDAITGLDEAPPPSAGGAGSRAGADEIDSELATIFESETRVHLAALKRFAADARSSGPPVPVSDELTRAFHTLCGISRTVGIESLAGLAANGEALVNELQEHELAVDGEALDLIDAAIEGVDAMLGAFLGRCEPTVDIDACRARIAAYRQRIPDRVAVEGLGDSGLARLPEVPEPGSGAGDLRSMPAVGADPESGTGDAAPAQPEPDAPALELEGLEPAAQSPASPDADQTLAVVDPDAAAPATESAQADDGSVPLDGLELTEEPFEEPTEPGLEIAEASRFDFGAAASPDDESLDLATSLSGFELAEEPDPAESIFDEVAGQEPTWELEDELVASSLAELESELQPQGPAGESDESGSRFAEESEPQFDPVDEDPELVDIFLEEAREHLDAMDGLIDEWRRDRRAFEPVGGLQRILHTLKGSARLAGVAAVGDLSHGLESLLSAIHEERIGVGDAALNLTQRVADRLSLQIEEISRDRRVRRAPGLLAALRDLLQPTQAADAAQAVESQSEAGAAHIADTPEPAIDETAPQADHAQTPETASVAAEPAAPPSASGPADEALDSELVEIFLEEADELLETFNSTLAAWRRNLRDGDAAATLRKTLHTLKGSALLARVEPIGALARDFERPLIQIIEGRREPSEALAELLARVAQRLGEQIAQRAEGGEPAAPDDLINALAALDRTPAETAAETESDSATAASAREVGEITAPPPAPKSGPPHLRLVPTTELNELAALLAAPAASAPKTAEHAPRPATSPAAQPRPAAAGVRPIESRGEQIRVRSDLLDRLVNHAGEVSIYRARLEQQNSVLGFHMQELANTVDRLRGQLRKLEMETEAQILFRYERDADPSERDFDPLELDRFSTIQQLSRALAETVSDLASIRDIVDDLHRGNETLLLQQSRVSTDLQDGLLRTRMVPFAQLVPRLQRVVRQTATQLDKQAELLVLGAEGEMDRTILDRMVPSLEHILRNALAHGIEPPAQRRAAGKPPGGRLSLLLEREGNDVVLTLSDDGRGFNLGAVRGKALERGLIQPEADISDEELMQFVLESGFSTADEVTQISGRGVGLDVVTSEVKQLGGSLEIESQTGRGSSFIIRLPLTLAITEALLVQLGDEIFAIPHASMEGVVRVSRDQLEAAYRGDETDFAYAGHNYRVRYLGALMGTGTGALPELGKWFPMLLVRAGERRVGLHVDALLGNRQIVVKSVGRQLGSVRWISGGTILSDGRVALIVDVNALVRLGQAQEIRVIRELAEPVRRRTRTQVMVVDDSITVRKVTQRLLERHDMAVTTAKDGVDAIAQLQESRPDIMLLDIEMPRMDGFELARHIQNSEDLRHIPIIMISSRSGEKHRQRAFELGVRVCLGKPYQETELIDSIASLVS